MDIADSPALADSTSKSDSQTQTALDKITVLLSFSGAGGVERMMMNLVREFVSRGVEVDLVLIRAGGPHLRDIPEQVRLIRLNASHTLTAIPELVRYLRSARPKTMLVAKDRAGRAALTARAISGVDVRICVRLGTNLSEALSYKSTISRWVRLSQMRHLYKNVDCIIGISEGVRKDMLKITGLPLEKSVVIPNPVVTQSMLNQASEPVSHLWYGNKLVPLIIGVGRLSLQKDFTTLIRAFALVRKQIEVRLIIVGEGGKRKELEALIEELALTDSVQMQGFQSNPFNWIAQADLFVLSSRWEGSGNVLTEALALGVPSVSTDCPSGPAETLGNGKYGPLVPVGDEALLAKKIMQTLSDPIDSDTLKQAVREYEASVSAGRYLKAAAPID